MFKSLRNFIYLGLEVLRSHFVYWLILYFVIEFYSNYVDSIRVILLQGNGVSIPVLVFFEAFAQFGMLIFNLIWLISVATVVLAPKGSQLTAQKIFTESTQGLSQLIREQLRVYGGVMWRLPFFIVFGLYKWLRWIMVPLIVVFDSDYIQGDVDALKRSEQLTQHHVATLLLILFISFLLPDIFDLIFISIIIFMIIVIIRIMIITILSLI